MKFRRKSRTSDAESLTDPQDPVSEEAAELVPAGPYDADDLPEGLVDDSWVDLGSLLLAPVVGKELRLQVDEKAGTVTSVMIAAEDGGMEMRAFAAPRAGDLWAEALPLLRADIDRRGGKTADREGPWGPELMSQTQVQMQDGQTGVQVSRMIGINGPRWMLRVTMLGRPAVEKEHAEEWEAILRTVVVRRGAEAKPKGEALDLVLPAQARRVSGQPTAAAPAKKATATIRRPAGTAGAAGAATAPGAATGADDGAASPDVPTGPDGAGED